MFEDILKKIAKIEINLIQPIREDSWKIINSSIFDTSFWGDTVSFKPIFYNSLIKKEKKLIEIQEYIQKSHLSKTEKETLLREVYTRLQKINFLKETYDIEGQKIESEIIVLGTVNYDFYNNLFFWVSHKDLEKTYYIEDCAPPTIIFSKQEVVELIKASHSIIPDIIFNFWDFPNFSHSKWKINISDASSYNLQNIISIFFHETTHFFRWYNGEQNLGFRYTFEGYNTLEEGIAIYNEYKYWNKLTNYWKFNPYYNICYQILRENITEIEKQQKIHEVLSCKWYNQEKSLSYYHRFNKYSQLWQNWFFLKDLVYESWYRTVKRLLRENAKNYEKIMSGHIGLYELQEGIVPINNNFDTKSYFHQMVREIKKYILKK